MFPPNPAGAQVNSWQSKRRTRGTSEGGRRKEAKARNPRIFSAPTASALDFCLPSSYFCLRFYDRFRLPLVHGHRVLVHPPPGNRPVQMDPARPLLAGGFPTHRPGPRLQVAALRLALARDRAAAGNSSTGDGSTGGWRFSRNSASTSCSTSRTLACPRGCRTRSSDPDFPAGTGTFRPRLRRTLHRARPLRVPGQRTAHHDAVSAGDIGLWPPYGRGLNNYMTTLSRVGQGVLPRREGPARDHARRGDPCFRLAGGRRDLRGLRPGDEPVFARNSPRRRDPAHAPTPHRHRPRAGAHRPQPPAAAVDAKGSGFSDYDFHWFQKHRASIDIIGLDYYEHTEVELYTTPEGYYRQRSLKPPLGLYQAAQDYWNEVPHPAHGHRDQRGWPRRRQDRVAGKERGRRAPAARGGFPRSSATRGGR